MNSNTIYFDLDGTLVDTYSDTDWQSKLVDQDVSIFLNPPSLVDAHEFTQIIHKLQDNGWRVGIVSAAPVKFYDAACEAKSTWLRKHFPAIVFDEIVYTRNSVAKKKYVQDPLGILVDDNAKQRHSWELGGGKTLTEEDLIAKLTSLLDTDDTELVETLLLEDSGTDFELGATQWLNNKYGSLGYEFTANRNNGHGDIQCIRKSDGACLFQIECKLGHAQAGQMSLKTVDEDGIIRYDYDYDISTPVGKLTAQILNLINQQAEGKAVTTAGINIEDVELTPDGDIIADVELNEDNSLFSNFVQQIYIQNKPTTKYFIYDKKRKATDYTDFSSIHPHIALTSNIHKVYKMSAKVRVKVDNSRAKYNKITDSIKAQLIAEIPDAIDILDLNGNAYVLSDKVLPWQEVRIGDDTYVVISRNSTNIRQEDGTYLHQIRVRKGARTIFIITLSLANYDYDNLDEFEKELKQNLKETLQMKTISEQLVINGEEIADELQICLDDNANIEEEPIVDEIEKEVQEAIDDAVEIVKDINEAEAQPVEFVDGEGSKVVVEHIGYSAKLRLDEAADDEEMVPLNNFIAFFKYGAHLRGEAKRIFENINWADTDDAFIPYLKNRFPQGISKSDFKRYLIDNKEELYDYFMVDSEDLDEDLPADLAKAYKTARNVWDYNFPSKKVDYKNAEYREATPEEAFVAVKNDPNSVRVLVNTYTGPHVVLFQRLQNGKVSVNPKSSVSVYGDKKYRTRNGNVVGEVKHMPVKYILEIADKIYITNEDNSCRDSELLAKRRMNPDSDNFNAELDVDGRDTSYHRVLDTDSEHRGTEIYTGWTHDAWSSSTREIEAELKKLKKRKAELDQKYDHLPKDQWSYYPQKEYERVVSRIDMFKDALAKRRFADSEYTVRRKVSDYQQLKYKLTRQMYEIRTALADVDYGKQHTKSEKYKFELNQYMKDLKALQRKIEKHMMELEFADEDDAKMIAELEQKAQDQAKEYTRMVHGIDQIMRRANTDTANIKKNVQDAIYDKDSRHHSSTDFLDFNVDEEE